MAADPPVTRGQACGGAFSDEAGCARGILRNAAKIWTTWGGHCAKFVCGVTFARRERHDWQMNMTPASTGGFGGMCRDRGLLLGKSRPRLQPSGAGMPHKVVITTNGVASIGSPALRCGEPRRNEFQYPGNWNCGPSGTRNHHPQVSADDPEAKEAMGKAGIDAKIAYEQ
jgi:hypothetical protein